MKTDLLASGIYTITEAARLLAVPPRQLRGWVTGYHEQKSAPLIKSELLPVDHQIALTFVNLIEARFIHAFAALGINVRSIRYMAEEARRVLSHPHPFATEMMFKTDGQRIFLITAEKTGDAKLYDLKGKNLSFPPVVMGALKKDVVYGPTGLAQLWYPRKETAPVVAVHPKIAFGKPVVHKAGVPTRALYEAYLAEDRKFDRVARWYEIPRSWVKQAVQFEIGLTANA